MPKMTDRERLAKIEADQRSLAREAETVRGAVRARYGVLATELPVETLSEREFRDVVGQAIRVGGLAAIAALKALPAHGQPPQKSPERRPSDEHGGAARRRPATPEAAASSGDGPGH
ncbi:hypothetical protein [Flavisphingomonas formosensis]|uniref:hypothetical protein n=1 Tax=Flavisphingomonas formosensis TaxID=861534 RepID=UPI001E60601A|nr:hypothetical protein [Sphingomonas formosensis]